MTPRQVFWDSCVFITLLSKPRDKESLDRQQVCSLCFQEAIEGNVEIFISTMTIVEVNRTSESTSPIPPEVRDKIKKALGQPFIKVVPADMARALEARTHIWDYSWLKPMDALHLACAIHAHVDEMFTYDGKGEKKGLLDLDSIVGTPPLKIRHPHFEGTQPELITSPAV